MKAIVLALFFLTATQAFADGKSGEFCQKIRYEDFAKLSRSGAWSSVVFFASWCGSCRLHIEQSDPERTIYVIAYDEPLPASKVLEALKPAAKLCLIDEGEDIRKSFGVNSLPAMRPLAASE